MAAPVQTIAFGVQDPTGARAIFKISPNVRVSGTLDFLGTAFDVVTFPAPPFSLAIAGAWVLPNSRCFASFVPTINQMSVGLATTAAAGVMVPMTVVQPDSHVFTT